MSNNFASGAANALPCIFSLEGLTVTDNEKALFKDADPLGFILFKRNIDTPYQTRALISELKEILGRDCPVMVDQEGGRVQRLRPPHWRDYTPMKYYGDLYAENQNKALEELRFETLRMTEELVDLGFNTNCAPVLDLNLEPETNGIGDRAFSGDPETVTRLALSVCRHFLKSGVTPIVKHIPGHGRANADSHHELPHIKTSMDELQKTDFLPLREVAKSDVGLSVWAMTAHIVFDALDKDRPVSVSKSAIETIRSNIGFDGIIIADDMDMKALDKYGSTGEKALASLNAGCDLALYCWAKMDAMEELAEKLPKMSEETLKRLQNGAFSRENAA